MKPLRIACLLAASSLAPGLATCATPFDGRWNIVVTPAGSSVKVYPDCMEGDHTGGMKYRNITVQVPKK